MTWLESGWLALGSGLGHPRSAWWPSPRPPRSEGVLHGASAGEVKAALALRPLLPGSDWTVSTGTRAGLAAGASGRLPRDVPAAVRAFFDAVRPERVLLVEGDLWPALLREAERRQVPVGLVGARLSPRSLRWWSRAPASARSVFGRVSAVSAASPADAERLEAVGVPGDRLRVGGWIKWPSPPSTDDVEQRRRELPAGVGALVVAGAVHPGELRMLADAFSRSGLPPSTLRWLVAPRHARALAAVSREARAVLGSQVTVERRFGLLRSWYGVADLAFVGGGAGGRGVHDLLEPLAVGRRAFHFADRGDPGGASAVLSAEGLAPRLDGPDPAAVRVSEGASQRDPSALLARFDGRAGSVAWLAERGVLPSVRPA